jgi:hypothetical protein
MAMLGQARGTVEGLEKVLRLGRGCAWQLICIFSCLICSLTTSG